MATVDHGRTDTLDDGMLENSSNAEARGNHSLFSKMSGLSRRHVIAGETMVLDMGCGTDSPSSIVQRRASQEGFALTAPPVAAAKRLAAQMVSANA
jgi:hypothetical protein